MNIPEPIRHLLNPDRFPHPVEHVEWLETHISWLLLAGDFAYKIKKPVKLPFLDYSTREKRLAYCHAEVALNQRYSPTLYLDVVDFDGEPAVRMQRFDEANRLDHVSARNELSPQHLSELARTIADYQSLAPVAEPDSPFGQPEEVAEAAFENFEELFVLLPHLHDQIERLHDWTATELERREANFMARHAGGKVRECHGDLHLGNMVLIDGKVTLFDCIEFNDYFRWIDVASEIAFTFIDLIDHRKPGLSNWLLNEWLAWSGDFEALSVLRSYAVYRAMVRAKISAIQSALHEAQEYLDMGENLAKPHPVRLTITCGLSGSGKTTSAQQRLLQDQTANTIRIRSDVERKRLFGLPPNAVSTGNIYGPEASRLTYDRLAELASNCLNEGWSVIVDAAFLKQAERQRFCALAHQHLAPFDILFCNAELSELRRRLASRVGDASEATVAVLEMQQHWFEPLADFELPYVTSQ